MRDDAIAAFLDRLAARVPAPGGGAASADLIVERADEIAAAVRAEIAR